MKNRVRKEYNRWRAKRANKSIVGPAVNSERRMITAMCEKLGVSRKKFRKMQKAKRREEREREQDG